MRKSVYLLIISLMSAALIGIIVVQIIWIRTSIKTRKKQFTREVYASLETVSKNIQNKELKNFYNKYSLLVRNRDATGAELSKMIYEQIDTSKNEKFTYERTILEQKFVVPVNLDNLDSLTIRRTFSQKDIMIRRRNMSDSDIKAIPPEERIRNFSELTELDKEHLKDMFYSLLKKYPIYRRVSSNELNEKLGKQFSNRGIETPYKFAVYDSGMLTSVKSGYFKIKRGKSYHIPLFTDNEGKIYYNLYVNFPDKENYILASISKNLILSIVFILMIIGVFSATLYQLNKQKQISAIKTDFINNMTHEFKTPIATINLALDAIKNPKIIGESDKVLNYIKMIRQENKRMHAQVETVLRISKLEKNQLEVAKEVIDIHDILDDAIAHIKLLIEDRAGSLKVHFEALRTEVLGNSFHLTNVFVNILDNSIKYSDNSPEIKVVSENISNNALLVHITDKGVGMGKHIQKQVFEKFYREEKGNIHNRKGHGLGLSYAKKVVELHQGKISVVSEKDKGSTFTVKLQVI